MSGKSSVCTAAKSLQSCPTLCDPIDGSPPGSPIPGILQARTLEWVAISFSNAWKWKVKVKLLSRIRLLETPWTAAYQATPSMGFTSQEYWSGLPFPLPGDLSRPRDRSQCLLPCIWSRIASRVFTAEPPGKPKYRSRTCLNLFFKSYTLFIVITKYWLYSLCCFVPYTLLAYLTLSATQKLF